MSAGSGRKIWWRCPAGPLHEWEARCPDRIKAPGCPFCIGRRVLPGFNDLATLRPDVAAQWHPTRNQDLTPSEVLAGTARTAWWQCPIDPQHEWQGSIKDRARGGGCPLCSGQLVLPGVNDLATTRPDLAAQWHPTRNGSLDPTQVVAGGARKLWWRCTQDPRHEWSAKGQDRAAGAGCPFCANKRVLPGFNDLATTHPDLATQWHPTRNGSLDPTQVVAGTQRQIWWQCARGHDWSQTGSGRVAGYNCPVCANKRVLPGFNDLATTHPDLAAEFDTHANAPLTPADVVAGTGQRLWWRCGADPSHSWAAKASDRVAYRTGCPHCWYEAGTSSGEAEVADFVTGLMGGAPVQRNQYLSGAGTRRNYDIVLPTLKVAIVFNGVYYHSEACGRGPEYHAEKHAVAAAAGYQLITVWQDDWANRREVVKQMLAHKLRASTLPRVPARKTTPVVVAPVAAREFLESHHIQGHASGSIRLGLRAPADASTGAPERLVALLIVRVSGSTAEIVRYATSAVVAGGFTRLLAHLERHLQDRNAAGTGQVIARIKTFSDHTVSDGDLYRQSGFVATGTVPPDYTYLVQSVREHKFNYRLARFRSDDTLSYVEGETEAQLAARNGLLRIWDSGKTRWEKPLPAPVRVDTRHDAQAVGDD